MPAVPKAYRRVLLAAVVVSAIAAVVTVLIVITDHSAAVGWNVVLITLDTTRADHLGCYDYQHVDTPTIDALSREGVRYERCYSPVPLTLPSHCSIMTGLQPPRHGVRVNGTAALAEEAVTLAEISRRHGYATGAVIGAFVLDGQFGLRQGFDYYDDDLSGEIDPSPFRFVERNAKKVTDAALSWLKQSHNRPTFLWVHYFDPHEPYEPPGFNPAYANQIPYDAEISFVDSHLKRLIAFIDGAEATHNTLIILVGDHGEALWEHGEPSHGLFTYEATLRVPLIVRFPDARRKGTTIRQPVALADIFPSTLAWLGLESPSDVDGHQLPIDGAQPVPTGVEDRPIYFENQSTAEGFGWSPLAGIVLGEYKFIQAPQPELYNVVGDPYESENLYDPDDARSVSMSNRLNEVVARLHAEPQSRGATIRMTEDTAAKLRSLGYVATGGVQQDIRNEPRPAAADPKDRLDVYHQILAAFGSIEQRKTAEAADSLIEIVTSKDPTNRRAFLLLAGLILEEEVRLRIIDCLQRAETRGLGPNLEVYVRGRLGAALASERRYDEALEELRAALALDADSVGCHWYLARVLQQLGAPPEDVLPHLQRLVALVPDESRYTVELAIAHEKADQIDQAIAVYEAALKRRPDDATVLNNFAYLLATRDRELSRGLKLVEGAIELGPGQAAFHDTKGYILLKLDHPHDAMAALQRAIEIEPGYATAHYHVALTYQTMGNFDEAVLSFRRAIDLAEGSLPSWLETARTRLRDLTAHYR